MAKKTAALIAKGCGTHETLAYDEKQIERIVRVGFEQAGSRRGKLHNIHKSNVLMSSVLWNEVFEEVQRDYPDIEVHHLC